MIEEKEIVLVETGDLVQYKNPYSSKLTMGLVLKTFGWSCMIYWLSDKCREYINHKKVFYDTRNKQLTLNQIHKKNRKKIWFAN